MGNACHRLMYALVLRNKSQARRVHTFAEYAVPIQTCNSQGQKKHINSFNSFFVGPPPLPQTPVCTLSDKSMLHFLGKIAEQVTHIDFFRANWKGAPNLVHRGSRIARDHRRQSVPRKERNLGPNDRKQRPRPLVGAPANTVIAMQVLLLRTRYPSGDC